MDNQDHLPIQTRQPIPSEHIQLDTPLGCRVIVVRDSPIEQTSTPKKKAKLKRLTVLRAVLARSCLSTGCAVTGDMLHSAGESYQCERGATNRPDEAQRRTECQVRQQVASKDFDYWS